MYLKIISNNLNKIFITFETFENDKESMTDQIRKKELKLFLYIQYKKLTDLR